jgi:hypothetical protein
MTSAVALAQLGAANSPVGYRNKLINGSFDLWQRGTSFSNAQNIYTADRWKVSYNDCGGNYTQTTSDLTGFNQYMRMIKGGVPFGSFMIQQAIETINCADLIGQRVVFSCWARLSNSTTQANHSLTMALGFSATTDYSGWLNSADICSFYGRWLATGASGVTFQAGSTSVNSFAPSQSSGTLTTTWQRYFYTLIVPPNTRTVVCGVYSESTVQNGGIDVTGIQMEIGSVPTAFDRRHIQTETELCERYYRIEPFGADFNGNSWAGGAMKFSMRRTPDIVSVTYPIYLSNLNTGAGSTNGLFNLGSSPNYLHWQVTITAGGRAYCWGLATLNAEI